MKPAVQGFTTALQDAQPRNSFAFPVYSNVDTAAVSTADNAALMLITQLVSPVRWTMEMQNVVEAYPGATYVEMGPGSVLAGLMKKIAPDVKTMTCGTAAEVNALL